MSLTRLFSPSVCVLLSFLIENFYPHSLKRQKRASFESRAVPGPPLHMQSQVQRNNSSHSLYPTGGWFRDPHNNEIVSEPVTNALRGRVEKRYRKSRLLWSLEISQGPNRERERKEEDSLLHSSRSPNPSTQVANGHCPKDPPPQPIHSHLRLEKTEFLPVFKSALGLGGP